MSSSAEELKKLIGGNRKVDEIIVAFEKWCQPMGEDDLLMFETGTFDFTGEELFYFSLTKQIPNEDDEYYQIHMDILYEPDSENKNFSDAFQDETGNKIFKYIRSSKAFEYAQSHKYKELEIYADET